MSADDTTRPVRRTAPRTNRRRRPGITAAGLAARRSPFPLPNSRRTRTQLSVGCARIHPRESVDDWCAVRGSRQGDRIGAASMQPPAFRSCPVRLVPLSTRLVRSVRRRGGRTSRLVGVGRGWPRGGDLFESQQVRRRVVRERNRGVPIAGRPRHDHVFGAVDRKPPVKRAAARGLPVDLDRGRAGVRLDLDPEGPAHVWLSHPHLIHHRTGGWTTRLGSSSSLAKPCDDKPRDRKRAGSHENGSARTPDPDRWNDGRHTGRMAR